MDAIVQCWQQLMQVVILCIVCFILSMEDLVYIYDCIVILVYVFRGLVIMFVLGLAG